MANLSHYDFAVIGRDAQGRLLVDVRETDGNVARFIEPKGKDYAALRKGFDGNHAEPFPMPRGHMMFKEAAAILRGKMSPKSNCVVVS